MGTAWLLIAQAVTPDAPTPAAQPPVISAPMPQRVAIDPAEAVAAFRALCLPTLTDPAAFAAAVAASGMAFVAVPRRDAGAGQTWRADRALLTYSTARDGAQRCTLLGRTAGILDQLGFSARVAEALALKTGRTRTGKGQAVTDWSAAGPEGRTVRISAATRNGPGGGTDIRLSAALGQ